MLSPWAFIILLFFVPSADARIIRVPQDAPEISEAISATQNSDTVLVSPGLWLGKPGQGGLGVSGKNITIASLFLTTQDSSYIAGTIIKRNGDLPTITFGAGVDSTTVLCGLTIQNESSWDWGAVRCVSFASPTLRNLVINTIGAVAVGLHCSEAGHVRVFDSQFEKCTYGGAFLCEKSKLTLENTTITDCWGSNGFLSAVESELNLKNVIISKNNSYVSGIYLKRCPVIRFENVTITHCDLTPPAKGIIGAESCPVVILDRVTMIHNSISNFPWYNEKGIGHGGIWVDSGELTILNSIIRGNTPADIAIEAGTSPLTVNIAYSDIAGGMEGISSVGNYTLDWGPGNIDADPLFADPATGDFRLKAGSPCIDTGTAVFRIGDRTILNLSPRDYAGAAPDMGAYEFSSLTAVEEEACPAALRILPAHPNPFNPSTTLVFSLPAPGHVTLVVYSVSGQVVRTLASVPFSAGAHSVVWNGRDDSGQPVSSGVYISRLTSGRLTATGKMVLLK